MQTRQHDFADDGASFRVRRERQLREMDPPLLAPVIENDQRYVYEHIFSRGTLRLLRIVRIPIFLAAAYLAFAIGQAIVAAIWQAVIR